MISKRDIVGGAVGGAILVALLSISGCGKFSEPFQDAPVSGHNDDPAEIVNMPDGFNNVASKCDGTNRVYTAYHADASYAGVAVVANDPRCQ